MLRTENNWLQKNGGWSHYQPVYFLAEYQSPESSPEAEELETNIPEYFQKDFTAFSNFVRAAFTLCSNIVILGHCAKAVFVYASSTKPVCADRK
jgi:hypothetical protein